MAERLSVLGREVRLVVIPGGVHLFNFRQREEGEMAWRETLAWVAPPKQAGG